MPLKYSATASACLLVACIIGQSTTPSQAKPTYDIIDDYIVSAHGLPPSPSIDSFDYDQPYGVPLTSNSLRRLRRGYYYVDDGYISAVTLPAPVRADRREDLFNDARARTAAGTSEYRPVVAVRKTRTKRKKLFVPNFFG